MPLNPPSLDTYFQHSYTGEVGGYYWAGKNDIVENLPHPSHALLLPVAMLPRLHRDKIIMGEQALK